MRQDGREQSSGTGTWGSTSVKELCYFFGSTYICTYVFTYNTPRKFRATLRWNTCVTSSRSKSQQLNEFSSAAGMNFHWASRRCSKSSITRTTTFFFMFLFFNSFFFILFFSVLCRGRIHWNYRKSRGKCLLSHIHICLGYCR